jgi:hypothetical protein
MNVRYRVDLSQAERGELTAMLSKGKRAARKLKRAPAVPPASLMRRKLPAVSARGWRRNRVPGGSPAAAAGF